MEQVSVYMEGVRDSSRMLLELTEYLDTLSEPTLLVFFGDHRPNIGDAISELGLVWNASDDPEDIVDAFSVPFLIRANRAFAERTDIPAAYTALDLPENHTVSDNYLGSMILSQYLVKLVYAALDTIPFYLLTGRARREDDQTT